MENQQLFEIHKILFEILNSDASSPIQRSGMTDASLSAFLYPSGTLEPAVQALCKPKAACRTTAV